jgi:hypothetical protein
LHSNPNYVEHNKRTFEANRTLYESKVATGDNSWGWDLTRRRAGEWNPVD